MNTKLDVRRVWVQIEDHLAPYLGLNADERSFYYHLLRHSRLVRQRRLLISLAGLRERTRFSKAAVRRTLRRLVGKGCVRILERTYQGHLLEVAVPEEVPGWKRADAGPVRADLERANCLEDPRLRAGIIRRERNRCFYCLRRMRGKVPLLDHVVPRSRGGKNTYRNLVACCLGCNSSKRNQAVRGFLLKLYRDNRLSATELRQRLRALKGVQTGRRKPVLGC